MLKKILFGGLLLFATTSCENAGNRHKTKVEKVNRERCSFDIPGNLYLGEIDSSFDEQGYFRILSDKSENRVQLFVYNSEIDTDEELKIKVEALNAPDVFKAKSIDSVNQFGNYTGKGVLMKGIYAGGIIKGKIKVFCYSGKDKGFTAVTQIIDASDTSAFKIIENSFLLK
jgi:hypothetical protein